MTLPHFATAELPVPIVPSKWRLRVLYRGRERVRSLQMSSDITLGSSDGADWTLDDPSVSGLHCRVTVTPFGLEVTDLDSKNGLWVGSGRVSRALLSGPGGRFVVGETTVFGEDREAGPVDGDLGLAGESQVMERLRRRVLRFGPLRAPVLVVGESGTGKDLVARALHAASGRVGRHHALNVAALSETLLDAELFGHVRGAFTGAESARRGAFQHASAGTLFLDEIAEMTPRGQSKLLRVVEDQQVRAVGANEAESVDVRIVSATCAPLMEYIDQGRFRVDLYHRLSTLVIEVPPLRSRLGDIPLLARGFFEKIEPEVGPKELTSGALEVLKRSHFPGNVRELFSILYRAAALSSQVAIGPGELDVSEARPQDGGSRLPAERALRLLDAHGSVSAAARAAGVPRTTFRSVIERYRQRNQGQPEPSGAR